MRGQRRLSSSLQSVPAVPGVSEGLSMKRISSNLRYLFPLAFLAVAGASNAAVDAAVTTAISDTTADVKTLAGAFLILAVIVAGFHWMRRNAK